MEAGALAAGREELCLNSKGDLISLLRFTSVFSVLAGYCYT
jgi:hypothetical protein